MPAVDVAMARSLRGGVLDLFVASLRPAVERRSLTDQINDVGTAFSSWDNCMQATYCKWPVIALIIIGGLIIFSVIWCIIRCACCGLSCCCSCFSCLKCCGDCCGCCDPPRGSRRQYLDEPYVPPHHAGGGGYKSQEPMHTGFTSGPVPARPPQPKAPDYPQYATFEAGGKKDEDALPAMPSWEDAEQKKVLVEEEEGVEMDSLKKPEPAAMVGAGAVSPTGSRSPVPRSPGPRSPYGPPDNHPGPNGYFPAHGVDNHDPYSPGAPAYNQPASRYREPGQGYGMGAAATGPGRQSPRGYPPNPPNNGYNDIYDAYGNDDGGYGNSASGYGNNASGYGNSANGYGSSRDYPGGSDMPQSPYDSYGASQQQQPYPPDDYNNNNNNNNSNGYSSQTSQGYGTPRHPSPHGNNPAGTGYDNAPYPPDPRRSPAPLGQHGSGTGGGAYGSQRGYSPSPSPGAANAAGYGYGDGMNNGTAAASGFDFSASGYSRPSTSHNNGAGGYRQQASPVAELSGSGSAGGYSGYPQGGSGSGSGSGAAYPGYRGY
ncbi:hypothetical protein VTJ83DRAFT_654 [Remersonia thermophila]|uniref:Fibroin-3 related protein n=1 Tax=Remersonia thermophila TaxID=72144 RepID=A0ABR4DLN0_9PEZI